MALPCCSWHPSALVLVPDKHHVLPLAWGGPDEPANITPICPNTHRLVHRLLNLWKKHGGRPPWEVERHFNAFVRALARRGWEAAVAARGAAAARNLPDLAA